MVLKALQESWMADSAMLLRIEINKQTVKSVTKTFSCKYQTCMFKIKQVASFVALCDETCIYFRISISKFGCHPSQLKYVLRLQKDVTRALCHGRVTCHGRNTCHGSKFPNNNLNFRLASNIVMLLETARNSCASPIHFQSGGMTKR